MAAAAGHSTDLDRARRDGVTESPADVQGALGSLGGGSDERTAPVPVGADSGDEQSDDDEAGSASTSPSTVDPDSCPPSSLEPPPPPDPETSLAPPPTPAPAGAPTAAPAPAPGPVPTVDAVPTDVDPGFPVVVDWRINAENEHGQLAESRI